MQITEQGNSGVGDLAVQTENGQRELHEEGNSGEGLPWSAVQGHLERQVYTPFM